MMTGPVLMISHPGHEFFLQMLQYIKDNIHKPVLHCTGPYAMTKCMRKYLKSSKYPDSVKLISSSFAGLNPMNPLVKRMTIHHNAGTWKS
jgi:mannosyltransferase OCH1-like enzyme